MSSRRNITTKREYMSFRPGGMESDSGSEDFSDSEYADNTNYKSEMPGPSHANAQSRLKSHKSDCVEDLRLEQSRNDFFTAIINENLSAVQSLLEKGISVNSELRNGWNPLMYASNRGSDEIMRYLLDKGADPNSHNKDDFTALMIVCSATAKEESVLLKCMQHLIDFNADINHCDRYQMTALMFCARDGKKLLLECLLENDVKTESVDTQGWSALAWAISYGETEIIRILLKANPALENVLPNGQSLKEFANEKNQKEIADILDSFVKTKSFEVKKETVIPTPNKIPPPKLFPVVDRKQNNYDELATFLCNLRLSHLIPLFNTNQVKFSQFLLLKDDDLIKMGIDQLGTRMHILQSIKDVHRKEWTTSSINLPKSTELSCPLSVSMVANISKHLDFIRSTITFLHRAIKDEPQILERGQDASNIGNLQQHLCQAVLHNQNLEKEMQDLQSHLNQLSNNVEYKPVNLILPTEKCQKKSWKKKGVFKLVALVGGITVCYFVFNIHYKK